MPPVRGGAGAWRTTLPTFAGLAVLVVVLARLAFESGGFFAEDHLAAGAACFGALALLGALALPRLRPTNHALIALGVLTAFAAWTALSATWSPAPDEALQDFQRTLFYVGVVALAVLAAGTGRHSRLLPWAALTVCVVVVGAGLLSRIQPDVVEATGIAPGYRLSHPLTYWNAFGGMAAFGALLAAGLGSDPRAGATVRALATALAVPLSVAMYLSLSRGSWLSLAVGAVVLVLLTPYRISALITGGLVGVATGVCVLRLEGLDALVDDPALGSGQEAQGDAFTPFLVLATLAVAAAQLVIARVRSNPDVQHVAEAVRGRVLAVGALAAAVFAIVVYAAVGGVLEGRSAEALDNASDWVSEQWDDFLQTSTFSASGTDRLLTSRGTRSDLYRVAIDGFESKPLQGEGAAAFEWRWFQGREVQEDTSEPHSLWIGTLSELGLVGALLLLGFLAALAEGVRRGLRRKTGLTRGQTAAVAAAASVWVVHSAVDWDWEMPAFTGTVLLAAAALLPPGSSRRRRRAPGDLA